MSIQLSHFGTGSLKKSISSIHKIRRVAMKHSLEFYGPVDDSNRIARCGTTINSSIANIKNDAFPKQVADAVPNLIYDHRISRIQIEIKELRAMLEGIKNNI